MCIHTMHTYIYICVSVGVDVWMWVWVYVHMYIVKKGNFMKLYKTIPFLSETFFNQIYLSLYYSLLHYEIKIQVFLLR